MHGKRHVGTALAQPLRVLGQPLWRELTIGRAFLAGAPDPPKEEEEEESGEEEGSEPEEESDRKRKRERSRNPIKRTRGGEPDGPPPGLLSIGKSRDELNLTDTLHAGRGLTRVITGLDTTTPRERGGLRKAISEADENTRDYIDLR